MKLQTIPVLNTYAGQPKKVVHDLNVRLVYGFGHAYNVASNPLWDIYICHSPPIGLHNGVQQNIKTVQNKPFPYDS